MLRYVRLFLVFTFLFILSTSWSFCSSEGTLSVSDVVDLLDAARPDSGMELKSVNVSNETVSASDASGFKAVMLTVLGDYETVVTDYVYSNSSGYTTHSITIERDWSWIMSAAMLIVVVFCTFLSCSSILKRF